MRVWRMLKMFVWGQGRSEEASMNTSAGFGETCVGYGRKGEFSGRSKLFEL